MSNKNDVNEPGTEVELFEEVQGDAAAKALYREQQLEAYTKEHLMKCSSEDREVFRTHFREGLIAGMSPAVIEGAFRADVKVANHKRWVALRSKKSPLAAKLVELKLVV